MGSGTYHGDGDLRRVGEDEFHFVEFLTPAPVLGQCDPACTAVAEAVGHDYGRCVLFDCGDDESGWLGRHDC